MLLAHGLDGEARDARRELRGPPLAGEDDGATGGAAGMLQRSAESGKNERGVMKCAAVLRIGSARRI